MKTVSQKELGKRADVTYETYQKYPTDENKRQLELANLRWLQKHYRPDIKLLLK